MRVLIFTTAYLPFVGGAELAIKEITDRLSDISFTLITARFKRGALVRERIGNVEVYRVGLGMRFDKWLLPFWSTALARKLHTKTPFDAVWAMMASQASIAAAWFKNRFPKVPLVLTLQEGDEESHLRRYVFGNDFLYRHLIRPWHTLVFKKADRITAISRYLAERARAVNPSVPIEVIPNGVDVEKFKVESLKFKVEDIRKKLGIRPEERVVITTSRLVQKNGVWDLIAAMQYLPENVKLIICGTGALEHDYKLKAKNYKLENRIRFLGHIPHEQLPSYLHSADIFCRPSLSEGFGTSFVEAMAAGLPVVATPVGGIPDFLTAPLPGTAEEKNLFSHSQEFDNRFNRKIAGLFCRVGNPKDIATKIELLLSGDALRNRIIFNAREMLAERYDWESISERMREVLTDSQRVIV